MSHVLIVDDVYSVRLKTELVLRNAGLFAARSVGSGEEALALLGTEPPDAIVMDIVMAGMDGIATLQALRARGFHGPVIAYTARRPRWPDEFESLGFDAFVSKAESFNQLIVMLRILLNRKVRRCYSGECSLLTARQFT